jgi:hypothetical protein
LKRYAEEWVTWDTKSPRYEIRSGSGDYLTLRQAYTRAGKDPPSLSPPLGWHWIIELFWRLKRFCGDPSEPITPGLVNDYGYPLSFRERELIFDLDASIRNALSEKRRENDKWISEKSKAR